MPSVAPQCDDRIQPRGPSRGQRRSHERDGDEQGARAGERREIGNLHTEDERAEDARERQRQRASDGDAGKRKPETVAGNESRELCRRCAKRQAHAHLARAPRHRIRHDAIEAECREQQREQAEPGEERADAALFVGALLEDTVEGTHVKDRQRRVERANLRLHGRPNQRRRVRRPDDGGVTVERRVLGERDEQERTRILGRLVVPRVASDPDDFECGAVEAHRPSERFDAPARAAAPVFR